MVVTPSVNSNGDTVTSQEAPIIYTTDEDGKEHRFQMIDMIEVEGCQYGLLLYLTAEDAAGEPGDDMNEEVVVMRILEENGEHVFEAIEDEDEFERVVAYVEQMDTEEDEGEHEHTEGCC
jgi:uncharacterized protein YrzB (UPF0473 family)